MTERSKPVSYQSYSHTGMDEMKSNSLVNNNSITENNNHGLGGGGREEGGPEDLFGAPVKNYGASFCTRSNRPTMISAKYRQKEERRKVLKISINKLKKIEDPESSLRRSVLINNTMKRLQREAREEKLQKASFRCSFEEDKKEVACQLVDITNLERKEEVEVPGRRDSRKRSVEEEAEDVQAVLSQFYMPLTPRMLGSLEEDEPPEPEEPLDVVDLEPKRPRLDPPPGLYPEPLLHPPLLYHSLVASLET